MYSIFLILVFGILIEIFHDAEAVSNGKFAYSSKIPYAIYVMNNNFYCGGALISDRHVLTAGHCINGLSVDDVIIIGDASHLCFSNIQIKSILAMLEHPDYFPGIQPTSFDYKLSKWFSWFVGSTKRFLTRNDIAILELKTSFSLGRTINTIKLPESPLLPYGKECTFAGWGLTSSTAPKGNLLRYISLTILTKKTCNKKMAKHGINEFCAIDRSGNSAPLSGDSGSPLVYNNTLIGILSRTWGHPKYGSIFTQIYSFKEFIEDFMKESLW